MEEKEKSKEMLKEGKKTAFLRGTTPTPKKTAKIL